MGQSYSKYLTGNCLNVIATNNFRILRTITSHILFSSPTGYNNNGLYGCGTSAFSSQPNTEQIPFQLTYAPNIYRANFIYGQTTSDVNLDYYFCEADLAHWLPRDVYEPNIYLIKASGPGMKNTHAWQKLQRKTGSNNTYTDRYTYDWLDATNAIIPEGKTCQLNDWLASTSPANPTWSNIPEPFLINNSFEDSGSSINDSLYLGNENFMPFCNPLPYRNASGDILGVYTGFAFSTIFEQAAIAFPMNDYLPDDPNSSLPTPPKVDPTRAFYHCEVSVFLASNSGESPLIGKKRFWMYSNAGVSGGTNWYSPYFTMIFGSQRSDWNFNVNFNYLGGGSETIPFNLSNMVVMVGA